MKRYRVAWPLGAIAFLATGCVGGGATPGGANPLASAMPSASASPQLVAQSSSRPGNIKSGVYEGHGTTPSASRTAIASITDGVSGAVRSAARRGSSMLAPKPANPESADPLTLAMPSKTPGPELYILMAQLAERSGETQKVEELYQKALTEAPNHVPCLVAFAHLRERQGRLEEAAQLYLRATQSDPNSAPAHNDLGLCYARQGRLHESVAALDRAIALRPGRKLYRNNIAAVLIELNRTEDGLTHLTTAFGEAAAHNNVAWLLHKRGRDREAAQHFAMALNFDPTLSAARTGLEKLGPVASSVPPPRVSQMPSIYPPNHGSTAPLPASIPQLVQPNSEWEPHSGGHSDRPRSPIPVPRSRSANPVQSTDGRGDQPGGGPHAG